MTPYPQNDAFSSKYASKLYYLSFALFKKLRKASIMMTYAYLQHDFWHVENSSRFGVPQKLTINVNIKLFTLSH